MGPKWFKVPPKCLLIYLIWWFDLVRNMWGFKATPNAPTTANKNLTNKPYFCLSLLANLADILRPVDVRLIILDIFDTLFPPQDGIQLGALDGFWEKPTIFGVDVLQNRSETISLYNSEVDDSSLDGPSCMYGLDWDDVRVLLLLSWATLGSCLGVSLGYSSIFGGNQLSLKSILYFEPLCYMSCTRSVQFGGIVHYLMNGTTEK